MILEHNPEDLHGEAKNVDQLIKATNDIKVLLPFEYTFLVIASHVREVEAVGPYI